MHKRAFSSEFIQHAKATSGWPPEASVKSWCGEKGNRFEFMRNGVFAQVARGAFVDDRHVRLVIYYILHPAHALFAERRSLNQFLAQHGVADADKVEAERVIELVSIRQEIPDDGFGVGIRTLLAAFDTIAKPWAHVRLIERESEVRKAMWWICVEAGRQLGSLHLPEYEALKKDEARMGKTQKEYEDFAVMWWKANPWTVVHAVNGQRVTGVCMALPVTETFYNRARSGECGTYDCKREDIELASSRIIVEGVAPEVDLRTKHAGPGESLVMAAMCQEAHLSDVPRICLDEPLRLLSFIGTPVGKRRLKKFGYKQVGTFFPGTEIEYMERRLVLSPLHPGDAALVGVWKCLQMTMRSCYRDRPRGDNPLPWPSPETC